MVKAEEFIDVEIIGEIKIQSPKNIWSLEEAVLLLKYAIYFYDRNTGSITRGEIDAPCKSTDTRKNFNSVCEQADLLRLSINIYTLEQKYSEKERSEEAYSNLESMVNAMYGITLLRIKDFFKKDREVPRLTKKGFLSFRYQDLLEGYSR